VIDLDAIKARAEVATPGPWEEDGSEIYVVGSRAWVAESCHLAEYGVTAHGDLDAEFIAHARTDVPALVAEVERLRADLAGVGRMAREDYARAEQAEQALVAAQAEMEQLRATALAASWRVDL
jgi:hypothetical protein